MSKATEENNNLALTGHSNNPLQHGKMVRLIYWKQNIESTISPQTQNDHYNDGGCSGTTPPLKLMSNLNIRTVEIT
jgi:hypothetical protein